MDDAWEPELYRRFADERAQPFHDLLRLVGSGQHRRVVDLGCGTGELTSLAARSLGARDTLGIDNSDKMLAVARSHEGNGVRFERGDIATWTSDHDVDVVIANASLQWVPEHARVLTRWTHALGPGGQLAVQVPANNDHPSHTISAAMAIEEPYHTWLAHRGPVGAAADPVERNVLSPQTYAELLDELGFREQTVRLQVYGHRLESTGAIVDWVRGTSLTRFRRLLSPDEFETFVADYRVRLLAALGDRSPCFFPFKRILMWGRLGEA